MNQKQNAQINWKLLITAYFSLLCHALFENGRGPAYPQILEFFNVSSDRGSLLFAIGTLAGLIVNLTSKWWLPKFGAIKALRYSSTLMFLGSFLYFLFPWQAYSFSYLIFASCIAGIGASGSAIPMNILTAKSTSNTYRRRALAGLHGIYGVSSLSVPFLFSFWMNSGFIWYSFFLLISLAPFILFILTNQNFEFQKQDYSTRNMNFTVNWRIRFLVGLCFALYVSGEILISSRLVYYLQETTSLQRQVTEWSLGAFFSFSNNWQTHFRSF